MLSDRIKRIVCLLPGERLILSPCPRLSDPISVLQSALTLHSERSGLKETLRRSAGPPLFRQTSGESWILRSALSALPLAALFPASVCTHTLPPGGVKVIVGISYIP